MGKFGLLHPDKGNWNGKQIIPTGWVQQFFEKHQLCRLVIMVIYGGLNIWMRMSLVYSKTTNGNDKQKIYISKIIAQMEKGETE